MAARSRFGLKPIRTFQEGFTIHSLLEALDTDDDNEGENKDNEKTSSFTGSLQDNPRAEQGCERPLLLETHLWSNWKEN